MDKNRYARIVALVSLLIWYVQPIMASAQLNVPVNYNDIISDGQLVAYQTMDVTDIQRFLEAKQSYLSTYFIPSDTGERVSAASLIFQASQDHRVNPQFLLALLQKEEGLIEDATPTQNQLDWATGYGCLDNQQCNERWRGFAKQINSAAEQFRYYYDNIGEYNYRPGVSSVVDGTTVTPKNTVTAALYNYTPHLQGNALFRALWTKYFTSLLPDGTLVQVKGDPVVWLLRDGEKRAFKDWLSLVSRYDPKLIVIAQKEDVDSYSEGSHIEFAAYALLRGSPSNTIYLLTTDQKRLITSMEVFRSLGFNPEEVEIATDDQLAVIPEGRPITLGDSYPTGSVVQNKKNGELYYLESGRKYPIVAKEILRVNFPRSPIVKLTEAELDAYASGFPVQFKEGTIVKGSTPAVYVISNQKKRLITSEKIFNAIGYKWSNIVETSDDALNLHPTGDPITFNQ